MIRLWVGVLVVLTASPAVRADDIKDKAVEVVEKVGGKVARDENQPDKPVVGVDANRIPLTDAWLKDLATHNKKLTVLYLDYTSVTDAGLKELAQLKNLTGLYLTRTQVTDAGVKELQKALPRCSIYR